MNMTWVRTPQILLAVAVPNAQKHAGQSICQDRSRTRPSIDLCPFEIHSRLPKLRIRLFIEGLAKPFCIQDRFDSATCGHSQLNVSRKADNGPWKVYDYLIVATPRMAVKALHTFWVLYPPKVSLRSDILEGRHQAPSFNWLGKLFNKAQKQSEPLTRWQSLVARVTWSERVWWKKKSCPSCQLRSIDSIFLGIKDVFEVKIQLAKAVLAQRHVSQGSILKHPIAAVTWKLLTPFRSEIWHVQIWPANWAYQQQSLVARVTWSQSVWRKEKSCPLV